MEISKESIREVLEENKRLTSALYTLHINGYKTKIDNLFPKMLECWCLVHYYNIVDKTNKKECWGNELIEYLFTISRYSIKDNNSIRIRQKVLNEIWDENDYSIPKILNMAIINKMIEEPGVDITSEEYGQTITECINAKQDIINAILLKDVSVINLYVKHV